MKHHAAVGHRMITDMVLLGGDRVSPVHAELRYYRKDPLAVQLRLSIGRSPTVLWVFSRDLLMTGLRRPSGVGDVRLCPTHDTMIIELRSVAGKAVLLAYLPDVASFLDHTVSFVPVGSETALDDIDGELIELGHA